MDDPAVCILFVVGQVRTALDGEPARFRVEAADGGLQFLPGFLEELAVL